MLSYSLPAHVHFCQQDDVFIFLDLRADEYSALDPTESRAFARFLQEQAQAPEAVHLDGEIEHVLQLLIEKELIVVGNIVERPVRPTAWPLPTAVLLDDSKTALAGDAIPFRYHWHFWMACLSAHHKLRSVPIERVVELVRARKAAAKKEVTDVTLIRQAVAFFHRMRVYFPREYLCLFDAFALVEFLARLSIYPNWVYGISSSGWAAHCWVEQHSVLYNEIAETAQDYVPILVV